MFIIAYKSGASLMSIKNLYIEFLSKNYYIKKSTILL